MNASASSAALLVIERTVDQLKAISIGRLKLLVRASQQRGIIESGNTGIKTLMGFHGLPEGTFAKDAKANGFKRFERTDSSRVIMLEFDPANAFGDPAERVIKARI